MKTIQLTHNYGALWAQLKQIAKWTFWTVAAFVGLAYAAFFLLIIAL